MLFSFEFLCLIEFISDLIYHLFRRLFADEPTGNLDSKTTVEIMNLLCRLNTERGISVIMVTHEDDVAAYAKRIVRVRDGLIESDIQTP